MTSEDKKRLEEIRRRTRTLNGDVDFLLAQLDRAHELQKKLIQNWNHTTENLLALEKKYEVAHAALRFYGDVLQVRCRMKEHDNGERARKALDGSTDPDTGTKGSLGEE